MKLRAFELNKPVEDADYYSNFDPEKSGYIRFNGLVQDKTYTLADLNYTLEQRSSGDYNASIRIPLNQEYTTKTEKLIKTTVHILCASIMRILQTLKTHILSSQCCTWILL